MSIREFLADIEEIIDFSFDSFLDHSPFVTKLLDMEDLDNSEVEPVYWETSMYFLSSFTTCVYIGSARC